MGLFDAFKRSEPQAPAAPANNAGGLDFMAAIEAHIRWKIRLENYIEGTSTEKLDIAVVGADNMCALGKWIYGEGAKYNGNPLFEEIRQIHAEFHKGAARIITMADAGQKAEAMDAVQRGDHFKNSQRIKAKLARMHMEIKGAEE